MAVFTFELPDGRQVDIDAPSQEAAQKGLKNIIRQELVAQRDEALAASAQAEQQTTVGGAVRGMMADPRNPAEQVVRQVGRAADIAIEGAGSVLAVPANAVASVLNLGIDAYDSITGQETEFRFPDQNRAISGVTDAMGLPEPEGRVEEVVDSVGQAVAAAGTGVGLAGQVAKRATGATKAVSNLLAAAPAEQAASAATGIATAELAKEAGWDGPIAQTVAFLTGAMGTTAAAGAARGMIRGTGAKAEAFRKNLDDAARASAKNPDPRGPAKQGLISRIVDGPIPDHAVPTVGTLVKDKKAVSSFEKVFGSRTTRIDEAYEVVNNKIGNRVSQLAKQRAAKGGAALDEAEAGQRALKRLNKFIASHPTKTGDDYNDLRIMVQKMSRVGTTPEEIFDTVVRTAQSSPSQAKTLFEAFDADTAEVLRSNLIARMGKAAASRQGAGGNQFSVNTFLTNWNKIDNPAARQAVFGAQLTDELNTIARASERLSKQMARKPLGGGADITVDAIAGGVGWALFGGPLGSVATGAVSRWVAPAVAGRLMASPRFVRWLAKSTRAKSINKLTGLMAGLATIAEEEPELAPDIQEYMQALKAQSEAVSTVLTETTGERPDPLAPLPPTGAE